jgi:chromate transporter
MPDVEHIPAERATEVPRTRLRDLAILFLRLGTTAFGGPAAHIAILEDEIVRRRRWLTHDKFLDLLGAVNLIPGPNSTEMAIYIGYLRAGWAGLLVGGVCFILPAMAMVTAIAWAYLRFGGLPQFTGLLAGVKPVVMAVILQALWGLSRRAVKTPFLAALAVAATVAAAWGVDPLTLLLLAGLVTGLERGLIRERGKHRKAMLVLLLAAASLMAVLYFPTRLASPEAVPFGLGPLLLYFLKIGAVLYGSGYVLLAFLEGDLVHRWHWLSSAQLLDATAVGQVTPGPLFTTATFIGYLKAGLPGAVLATVAIFLPSFVFIALSGPLIPRLRKSPIAGAFLDGVTVASLALMAAAAWSLGRAALYPQPYSLRFGMTAVVLLLASAVLLLRFRVNPAWLVLGGACLGLIVYVL